MHMTAVMIGELALEDSAFFESNEPRREAINIVMVVLPFARRSWPG
jgi:hypothetical protein